MKNLLKTLIALIFCVVLLIPVVGIFAITRFELKQYQESPPPAIQQKSYGEPMSVCRMDMREFISLTGTFVSIEHSYMELPELRNAYSARMSVEVGDEISEGDLIGYTEDGKKELYATASGIIREIHLGVSSYIMLDSETNLALRCMVDEDTLAVLEREELALTDKNDDPVQIEQIGNHMDRDGLTEVLLTGLKGRYGQTVKALPLYTGFIYTQALAAPKRCLFHQPDDLTGWYVRVVSENGSVLGTQKVQVGFSDNTYICITGIEEGTWLDSGYAAVFGGGSNAGLED